MPQTLGVDLVVVDNVALPLETGARAVVEALSRHASRRCCCCCCCCCRRRRRAIMVVVATSALRPVKRKGPSLVLLARHLSSDGSLGLVFPRAIHAVAVVGSTSVTVTRSASARVLASAARTSHCGLFCDRVVATALGPKCLGRATSRRFSPPLNPRSRALLIEDLLLLDVRRITVQYPPSLTPSKSADISLHFTSNLQSVHKGKGKIVCR